MNAAVTALVGGEADWLVEIAGHCKWVTVPFRQHAHNLSGRSTDGYRPADDVTIASESQAPGVMTENHNSVASRILVGDAKGSTEQWLNSKSLEKTGRHSAAGANST